MFPAGAPRVREWTSIFGLLDPWWANTVRKINPALIHAHFEFAGILILPLPERLKVPLVLTCHGVDVTDHNYQWKSPVARCPLPQAETAALRQSGGQYRDFPLHLRPNA